MKYKLLIITFISIFPVFCFGQENFCEYGFSPSVIIPVYTPYEESYVGFGINAFDEIVLSDKVSIYSGTGMYVILTHKRDKYSNKYHKWANFDVMFEVGPKVYFGNFYTKLGYGFIWGESFRLAFIPSFGICHDLLDIGISYHYSNDYTFFEVKIGIYTF
jgi:hypothetical protein